MSKEDLIEFDQQGVEQELIVKEETLRRLHNFSQFTNREGEFIPMAKTLTAPTEEPENDMNNSNIFASFLSELATTAGPRIFYFPQAGKTQFRILWDKEKDEKPYVPVARTWGDPDNGGSVRTKYLIRVVVFAADKAPTAYFMMIGKKTLADIMNMGMEGFNLFHPVQGHGVSITKAGEGLMTTYQVSVSPKSKAIPEDTEWGEVQKFSLTDAVTEMEKMDKANATKKASGGGKKGVIDLAPSNEEF